MATLISRATGNFTASGTWEQVDITSYLDSSAASTAVSTSNLDSAAFTPGAITVTGIALKIATRAASPSGTFTVTLRNSSAGSDVASVTVNVSDLPYYANTGSQSAGMGWVFFKFSANQTLAGATNYLVRVVCSTTGSQVTLYRNATSNNWSRMLATSTTAAPASGDQLIIIGQLTGAGASNAYTVTMDNTATTSFGPTVSGGPPEGIVVGQGGTLTCGTSASTNYYLKWKGVFHITGGGVANFGTSGTPIPSTSTLTLYMDAVATTDTGFFVDSGGTLNIQGATKNHATQLTATASASATVLSLGSTSGWAANDVLGLGPGNTSRTEYQTATVSTVDSATQVTLTAGISAQKRGVAPHQTEVINLTRNVIIRGVSSSFRGYATFKEVCTATIRYASFEFLGASGLSVGKQCIDFQGMGAGAVTVEYCSFFESFNNTYLIVVHTSKTGSLMVRYCVAYKYGNRFFYSNGSSATAMTVTDNVTIGDVDGGPMIDLNLCPLTGWNFSRNVKSGAPNTSASGIQFNIGGNVGLYDVTGKLDDCRFSFCGVAGIYINGGNGNIFVGTIANLDSHLNSHGFRLSGSDVVDITLTNPTLWGNATSGIYYSGDNGTYLRAVVRGGLFAGSSLQAQSYGVYVQNRCAVLRMENCTLGVVSGIYVAHSGADIFTDRTYLWMELLTVACTLASSTEFSGFSATTTQYRDFRHQRYDDTADDHRRDLRVSGTYAVTHRRDTSIFNVASPSEKLTPSITDSVNKGRSTSFFCAVNSGASKTIKVYVRKSAAGDGAAYTGAEPRLILKANPALGIDTDTVLDTMTAATGTWEQLQGASASAAEDGVLEAYVDFDGSAGWINVDDWEAT